jgi:hypothetical protein
MPAKMQTPMSLSERLLRLAVLYARYGWKQLQLWVLTGLLAAVSRRPKVTRFCARAEEFLRLTIFDPIDPLQPVEAGEARELNVATVRAGG